MTQLSPRSRASRPMGTAPADDTIDRAAIDAELARASATLTSPMQAPVREAVRYALAGEGKRLRALLVLWSYRAAGGRGDASRLAAAVEVVHAYSLVHDDLPCMDDDAVRRGRPTVHRVYGVAAATAAGLAMVPLAVRLVLDGAARLELPPQATSGILRRLMIAAGGGGMIGGQLLDLDGEGRALSLEELEQVHRGKTGALIAASALVGGMAACVSDGAVAALERYGAAVGLAFQIADDVLDVTATSAELGKTAGKDQAVQKSTYPALLGLDGAGARARMLVDEGCRALEDENLLTPELARLARFAIERRR